MEIARDLYTPLIEEKEKERSESKITGAQYLIDKMTPVEFIYHNNKNQTSRDVGIHIEEKDVPEKYVYKKKDIPFLTADYLNTILLAALKDQREDMNRLENRVKYLENLIIQRNTQQQPSLL
jgi:hypothetical protein